MIRDVSTRWNSTAELIQRSLDLQQPLKTLVVMAEHNKPRGVRLSRFQLAPSEWVLLQELSPLLEVGFVYVLRSFVYLNHVFRFSFMLRNGFQKVTFPSSTRLFLSSTSSQRHLMNSLTTEIFLQLFDMRRFGEC